MKNRLLAILILASSTTAFADDLDIDALMQAPSTDYGSLSARDLALIHIYARIDYVKMSCTDVRVSKGMAFEFGQRFYELKARKAEDARDEYTRYLHSLLKVDFEVKAENRDLMRMQNVFEKIN